MTGSIRKVAFLAVCGLLCASAVMAGVPSPGNSDIGTKRGTGVCTNASTGTDCASYIRLGGFNNSAVVEPQATRTITIRDAGNTPVQNSTVEIRFGTCTSTGEFRVCSVQQFPGVAISCVDKAVVGVTDAAGQVPFRVVGHALSPGGGGGGTPGAGLGDAGCAEVRADGILIGTMRVKAYDLNGTLGVNPVDLSLFLNDSFNMSSCTAYPRVACAAYRSRTDYNDDGQVNPVDLSLFLSVSFANTSINSCAGGICAP